MMFREICDYIVERSAVNITDLDTLDVLLAKPDASNSTFSRPWSVWRHALLELCNVNVILRLPLEVYKALENIEVLETATKSSDLDLPGGCSDWISFWSNICGMTKLRNLHIWLDHTHESSWSRVKERLILNPVFDMLEKRKNTGTRGSNFISS